MFENGNSLYFFLFLGPSSLVFKCSLLPTKIIHFFSFTWVLVGCCWLLKASNLPSLLSNSPNLVPLALRQCLCCSAGTQTSELGFLHTLFLLLNSLVSLLFCFQLEISLHLQPSPNPNPNPSAFWLNSMVLGYIACLKICHWLCYSVQQSLLHLASHTSTYCSEVAGASDGSKWW